MMQPATFWAVQIIECYDRSDDLHAALLKIVDQIQRDARLDVLLALEKYVVGEIK
jgi:hypothetical protein